MWSEEIVGESTQRKANKEAASLAPWSTEPESWLCCSAGPSVGVSTALLTFIREKRSHFQGFSEKR